MKKHPSHSKKRDESYLFKIHLFCVTHSPNLNTSLKPVGVAVQFQTRPVSYPSKRKEMRCRGILAIFHSATFQLQKRLIKKWIGRTFLF